MRPRFALFIAVFVATAPTTRLASAQATAGYYPGTSAAGVKQASYEATTGRSNPALEFYGSPKSTAYARQQAPQQSAPVAVQTAPMAKPFAGVQQGSNVSPYLALDNLENASGLPNYYLYVQPRLDQQQVNQNQRAQFRRMQTQLRKAAAGGAVSNPNGGIPTTGHSSQFMNIGSYYPGLR